MSILHARRELTDSRTEQLRGALVDAEQIAGSSACVYVTGSFGRREASSHSDLDLFIVGGEREKRNSFSNLNAICLKAELIHKSRTLKFPEFSGDGKYFLQHYTQKDLISKLGSADDDYANTLTARLLLLLESKPLIGGDFYQSVVEGVVAAYWGEFQRYSTEFLPAYLANDILRLWRTFCVNYEARTKPVPEAERAKRRLRNYKLKHSRLLTCYSALLYLLAVHKTRGTVTPKDALAMIALTPTERIETVGNIFPSAKAPVNSILREYGKFLKETDAPEDVLIQRFTAGTPDRPAGSHEQLGQAVFDALNLIGKGERFHRLITV